MSRSNPSDNTPNPSTRWYEWDGSNGEIRHYDKTAKSLKDPKKLGANITTKLPFVFIVLDETATVKGWHDASDSSIFSNEVRDTRAETLVVKSFKGGVLAEGFYASIRDRVSAQGGHFTTNLYIGYKDADGNLAIGNLQLKGAALNSWVEFKKANRQEIYKKAVKITGFVEGKKGKIIFRTPTFAIQNIAEKTNTEAVTLDALLQHYLKGYFSRTRTEQVAKPTASPIAPEDYPPEPAPEPPPESDDNPY
jgi:hypothetical protein